MAELSEEQLRIRGYLQAQAAKVSPGDLMAKVRADSAALRAACEAAERVDSTARPDPGAWSVNEVLAHLADTCERVNQGILAAVREGHTAAPLEDALRKTAVVRQPLEWWETISAAREATFASLKDATGNEHVDVRWTHPFFGDLNWREWLLFLRLHDGDHARQVQEIVATVAVA